MEWEALPEDVAWAVCLRHHGWTSSSWAVPAGHSPRAPAKTLGVRRLILSAVGLVVGTPQDVLGPRQLVADGQTRRWSHQDPQA